MDPVPPDRSFGPDTQVQITRHQTAIHVAVPQFIEHCLAGEQQHRENPLSRRSSPDGTLFTGGDIEDGFGFSLNVSVRLLSNP